MKKINKKSKTLQISQIFFHLGCYELEEDGHRFAAVIPSASRVRF